VDELKDDQPKKKAKRRQVETKETIKNTLMLTKAELEDEKDKEHGITKESSRTFVRKCSKQEGKRKLEESSSKNHA